MGPRNHSRFDQAQGAEHLGIAGDFLDKRAEKDSAGFVDSKENKRVGT